ncbi:conjugal transfer protein TrbL family protein [Faecalibacillus faecis]
MGQIVDWIYSKLLEFLGEFFGMMGSMGADLFDYDFVRAIIELFRLFWMGAVCFRNGRYSI